MIDLVKAGRNVFFTGVGGTGKTFLLTKIISHLRQEYGDDFSKRVAVTASTGIAASHIGGTTVHCAAGIGRVRFTDDFKRMGRSKNRQIWRDVAVWIVDEVSMLSGELFDGQSLYLLSSVQDSKR